MKRPILIITIAYISGIIWGLYFKRSMAHILLSVFVTITILYKKNKMCNVIRYMKVLIPLKVIFIFFLTIIFSSKVVINLEKKYDSLYAGIQEANWLVIVESSPIEKEYKIVYKVRVIECNNNRKYNGTYLNLEIKKEENIQNWNIGDEIKFIAEFVEPEIQRNEGGYNHKLYLKTQKIYGSVRTKNNCITLIESKKESHITRIASEIRMAIVQKIESLWNDETKDLLQGILIGYKDSMEEELKQNFRDSSLYHMLAVSGTHISYLMLGVKLLTKKIKISRKIVNIVSICILVCFIFITGFTPSVERATIMGIVTVFAEIIYCKSDFLTTISLSLLIILVKNPYSIMDIGLLLSFGGTLGIVLFSKPIFSYVLPNIENRIRTKCLIVKQVIKYIKQVFCVSIAAQLAIVPIILIYFNTFSFTFLITNLLAGPFIGIIIIGGIIIVFCSFVFFPLASLFAKIFHIVLHIFILIARIGANLPLSKIYISTPSNLQILIYYIYVFIIFGLTEIIYKKQKRRIEKCIVKKYKIIKKVSLISMIIIILFYTLIKIIPNKDVKLYFIDVGQGDCTLIVTPSGENILIDGGGSETGKFDVGKNVLFPYLLDKGINKIDYIMFSHFDTDHCQGLLYLLEKIRVDNVIISQQGEDTYNYNQFLKIIKSKKINIIIVQAGDRVTIDKQCYFSILWPTNELVHENIINNNSIVAKFYYKNINILFTGDIEAIAEEKILKKYNNSNILKADILKVAHHGSKSSSTDKFIKKVKPKVVLVGVGKNNTFGHPSDEVIDRLRNLRCKYIQNRY